jgi:hypothetical protein
MENIQITNSIIVSDDDVAAMLGDVQRLARWGDIPVSEATRTRRSHERQTLTSIARTYRQWAVERALEIDQLAQRRYHLPAWRVLANWSLTRRQAKALAHVRRHLTNLETVERAIECIPE